MDELTDRTSRPAPRGKARKPAPAARSSARGDEKTSPKKPIESELEDTKQKLEHLLAVSPAIIYTNKLSGDFPCTFVSENLQAIMGYSPSEMIGDQRCWSDHLHPEDASRVFEEMRPLIQKGGGTVEYRFQHRDGHYIWIQDTF